MAIFVSLATWFYEKCDGMILRIWSAVLIIGAFCIHLVRIDALSMSVWPVLMQLLALSIVYVTGYVYRTRPYGKIVFAIISVLTILITSLYVNRLTENVFAVTIYLTLLSAGLIIWGIEKDRPYLRTAGLYIGLAVLMKILFYDLWFGLDGAIIRVVALMISGGVMIGLSQLYGRSVRRSW